MRDDTFFRSITDDQRNILYDMIESRMMKNPVIVTKIILLKDEGYPISEIRMATNHHDVNIRKWIHSIVSTKKVSEELYPEKHIQANQSKYLII